jgi:hypothetical protein
MTDSTNSPSTSHTIDTSEHVAFELLNDTPDYEGALQLARRAIESIRWHTWEDQERYQQVIFRDILARWRAADTVVAEARFRRAERFVPKEANHETSGE